MLAKWKTILTHWIKCYLNEATATETVNSESLLHIISQLQESLSLDESISSILEAHTLDGFISEKYPEFVFENGTVEPQTEDDILITASLLLFFVCVTSKNVNIKNAMCNKLASKDQEVIMKFSKTLMHSNSVTRQHVENAILEACGQEVPSTSSTSRAPPLIPETPPALRSLHGEVRRLQAALDAEQFDRTFLQEELVRSNQKIEKLSKEKDEQKSELLSLRMKISNCGQDHEEQADGDVDSSGKKLLKQIDELEQRLVDTRAQLDDVVHERDVYKTKIGELKLERDKWLSFGQQESLRSNQLAEQLDTERSNVESLREMLAELRQHNRHNGVDSSMLECDDLDASVQSLAHNISVCNEVCANVVEVQLGEERAKIVVLKQQIQTLQDQLNALNKQNEEEKLSLNRVISEKDNDILNLKHRLNEEIEDKNELEKRFNDQLGKLHNEINELEQRIKENNANSTKIIENKMEEIKTLQEEKLSLLQSLSDETSKLENIIKDHETKIQTLTSELYSERNSKQKMKEDYENHVMKLNEKLLNRNNEVVDLQNNICEKGELIEHLQHQIRKEKEMKEQAVNKLQQDIEQIEKDREQLKSDVRERDANLQELQNMLQEKSMLIDHYANGLQTLKNDNDGLIRDLKDLEHRWNEQNNLYQKCTQELGNLNAALREQEKSYTSLVEEKQKIINSLETQMEGELAIKKSLQDELVQFDQARTVLADELNTLSTDFERLKSEIGEKERMIDAMDLYLNEEKNAVVKLKQDIANHTAVIEKNTIKISEKDDEIDSLQNLLDTELKSHKEEIAEKLTIIQTLEDKLQVEITKINEMENTIALLNKEKSELDRIVLDRSNEIATLNEKNEALNVVVDKLNEDFEATKKDLDAQKSKYIKLENETSKEASKLTTRVHETERILRELRAKSQKSIEDNNNEITKLQAELADLEKRIGVCKQVIDKLKQENTKLNQKLSEEVQFKEKWEKEYQNVCVKLEEVTQQMKQDLSEKCVEIEKLQACKQDMITSIDGKNIEIQKLEDKLTEETKAIELMKKSHEITEQEWNTKFAEIGSAKKKADDELKEKSHVINLIKKENENLQYTMEDDNSNHEIIVKEKDAYIQKLEEEIRHTTEQLQLLQSDFEDVNVTLEITKVEMQQEVQKTEILEQTLKNKVEEISKLTAEKDVLSENLQELELEIDNYEEKLHEKDVLEDQLTEERKFVDILQKEKQSLTSEIQQINAIKDKLQQQLTEITSVSDNIGEENNVLSMKTEELTQKLIEEVAAKNVAIEEKNTLLQEKEMLTQQLIESKLTIDVMTNEKETLVSEKAILATTVEKLSMELDEEKSVLDTLQKEKLDIGEKLQVNVQENASLDKELKDLELKLSTVTQELNKHMENEEILVQNINKLSNENEDLLQRNESLSKQLDQLNITLDNLRQEKESIVKNLAEQQSQKEVIISENIINIEKLEVDKTQLDQEIILLKAEKDDLVKKLTEEKLLREKEGSERKILMENVESEKVRHAEDLCNKSEEIKKLTVEMQVLNRDLSEKQDNVTQLTSTLSLGLTKIQSALKREVLQNELLKKLLTREQYDDMSPLEQCHLLVNIADSLTTELSVRKNLEKALEHETTAINELRQLIKEKENDVHELQIENKKLQQSLNENKAEQAKKSETYASSLEEKLKINQQLQHENQLLHTELNDVKVQLDVKVHSLKEKLVDNENLTEKLKNTYECQIENLNVMSNKLTNYLKDKAVELDGLRKEKEKLQQVIEDNNKAIKSLEEELKAQKQQQEKLILDFESERLVLKNMVTVTESVMEDQKIGLDKTINEHEKAKQVLQEQIKSLQSEMESEKLRLESIVNEKDTAFNTAFKELAEEKKLRESIEKQLHEQIVELKGELSEKDSQIVIVQNELKQATNCVQESDQKSEDNKRELESQLANTKNTIAEQEKVIEKLTQKQESLEIHLKTLEEEQVVMIKKCDDMNNEKIDLVNKCEELTKEKEALFKLKDEIVHLESIVVENKTAITNLEKQLKQEDEHNQNLKQQLEDEQKEHDRRETQIKELLEKAEREVKKRGEEIKSLKGELTVRSETMTSLEKDLQEKVDVINKLHTCLEEIKSSNEVLQKELESKVSNEREVKKQNQELQTAAHKEIDVQTTPEKLVPKTSSHGRDHRDYRHQVDMSTSDLASSLDSNKTITDLEKIIHDKNRTITTLQSDVTYLKTLMADSENKLLDVTKELEESKENCQQLSSQLKKMVQQKNDEIADLKKQVSKMSVTENQATQIIKVSAKYQAMILKRIAEIKSNTVLKELTNFGNGSNEDLKRIAGNVTMEDLENFLETTDRHLKRCADKQLVLQKERDRLVEVNRINESEIINLKKFLTELSVSFKTFNSVKELYTQKLSRVVSMQRTVRREILNLDGNISDGIMCKLERGYGAVMQDLSECVMNIQRWMERSISRTISPEKIKQAFTSEVDRVSLSSGTFQNTSIEVQLEELENSFRKLLDEVTTAHIGETSKETQASTLMEVRAEYEDKLNRMKAKMKQLYQEQIGIFKEKQKQELAVLEEELKKANERHTESSRAYEEHIRSLTTELWNVGEKLLVKKDEAEWLRRQQRHGSLMSLQHVPATTHEMPRFSDVSSLRSLPVQPRRKERRGLHMSDEEGEVFDNRCLDELNTTPRSPPRKRLSELQWRNSLCPPHLRSSYAVETQFSKAIHEEEIKSVAATSSMTGKQLRKEVGITAYKKPGPPTPSKQAGRLSATDSELRESLRVEPDPVMRKTTTPSRIRSLFFSSKNDSESTPRKRLSIFRNRK